MEVIYDVRQRVHADTRFVAGIQPQPACATECCAAEVERKCGCKTTELAPYAAILILPGGSVMALLMWLYRRQKRVEFLPAR